MVFMVYPQYADRLYNQRSLQVTTKISKSSVKRNMIKRIFTEQLEKDLPLENSFDGTYYKVFVYFHKDMPDVLTKLLANTDKNTIKSEIRAQFHEHFRLFPQLVCRFSDTSKNSVTQSNARPRASRTPREKNSNK